MKSGTIDYQQQEGRGIGIPNKVRAFALQYEHAKVLFDPDLQGEDDLEQSWQTKDVEERRAGDR